LVESGRVYLPEDAPWLTDFLEEVSSFPAAPHDDMVDALSQALNYTRGGYGGVYEFTRANAELYARGEEPVRDDSWRNWYDEETARLRAIRNTCAVCRRPVSGTGIDQGAKRFHLECFAKSEKVNAK